MSGKVGFLPMVAGLYLKLQETKTRGLNRQSMSWPWMEGSGFASRMANIGMTSPGGLPMAE